MKKFITICALLLIVSLTFIGCGESNDGQESAKDNVDNDVEASVNKDGDKVEESQTPDKVDNDEEKEKEDNDATSLEGLALLGTLNTSRPDKLIIESEIQANGIATGMITYYSGTKSRTETVFAGMSKNILISLPDEAVVYQYVEGAAQGVKMTGDDVSSIEDMESTLDDAAFLAEITEASSEDITAKIDTLDGEEVVYIEATESDEDMGEMLVKMWYSTKYATALKYQVFTGDVLFMELKVTNISDNSKIDDSLFTPPDDVSFFDMSMDGLFNSLDDLG